jgi:hypothetical protein
MPERRPSAIDVGHAASRDSIQGLPAEDVQPLDSEEEGLESARPASDKRSVSQLDEKSAEMVGFDDLGSEADQDGDPSDEEARLVGALDERLGEAAGRPTARRVHPELRFEPRSGADGSLQFTVRTLHFGAAPVQGVSDAAAELERERTALAHAIGNALAILQRPFLEALAKGQSFEEADRFLKPVTQAQVARKARIDWRAVSRMAGAVRAEMGCPGSPSFSLSKVMGRSPTLRVHPDALVAEVRRLGPGSGGPAELLRRLVIARVLKSPTKGEKTRSLREHLRQVCRKAGIDLSRREEER